MARIISFAWTTPALLAGRKTCTRREWKSQHAERFRAGDPIKAYDRQPCFGGKHVANLRLTAAPSYESTSELPESDWEAEGFEYLSEIGATVDGMTPRALWRLWRQSPRFLWVVRFELVEVLP